MRAKDFYVQSSNPDLDEAWSQKYKRSINCNNPKGFSQRAHCQGRKKKKSVSEKLDRTSSPELVIFDIDDTLLHTTAKINVVKDGRTVRTLTNQEFNNYRLEPGEEFDFGEFSDAKKFREESTPIGPMLQKLRSDLAAGKNVVMLTARADFDNQKTIWRTFKDYGIDINSDVHLFRAGNTPGPQSPAVKKALHISRWLRSGKYGKVTMYDDSTKNLSLFKKLEARFPEVKFVAQHVSGSGRTQHVEEITESATPGEWVYHAHYYPDQDSGLVKLANSGLRSSIEGQLGPGSYFAYRPEDTYYHVSQEDATMLRIRWRTLVDLYGKYPEAEDGVQSDGEQIVVPTIALGKTGGVIPAKYLEVEYFPGEWWSPKEIKATVQHYTKM